jgi:hypothetical protein
VADFMKVRRLKSLLADLLRNRGENLRVKQKFHEVVLDFARWTLVKLALAFAR